MDCEPICLREVDSLKLDVCLHEVRNKRDVTRKPIQLRNDQLGPMKAAGCERLCKLRSVSSPAALDLGEFLFARFRLLSPSVLAA
jgi:hypothetical protein